MSAGTGVLRGRDTETYAEISLTGSTGRPLSVVEIAARTVRFTGTLGASITLTLPLSPLEDRGRGYVFENETSGGFSVTLSPVAGGSGVELAAGAQVTCYYDGTDLISQGGGAASLPASVGGISTLYPLVITDPAIGDGISFDGDQFTNAPAMGVGKPITNGTAGSVLFVDADGELGQDNANLFWNDAQNRLGIGTASPNAPLHVENNSAATLATFKGTNAFASVFFQLGDGDLTSALRVYPGVDASGGDTIIETGGVIVRGHYWSGAASLPVDGSIRLHVADTTPRYFTAIGCNSSDFLWIRQDGQMTIGATLPTDSGLITEDIVLAGTIFWNGDTRINDTVNITLGTGTGTQWGTAANEKQGWWGATPVVRAAAPTGTDTQKIDGLITILGSYGLLG